MIAWARSQRKGMVRMPLTDVVEACIVVLGGGEKRFQWFDYLSDESCKCRESPAFSLDSDLLYSKRVHINMFCH